MNSARDIGLPEALERAAAALPDDADEIRPANGDPFALLSQLSAEASQRVLEWLLANEPPAGGELVEAWADAGGDAPAWLSQIDASGLPKPARKALRRAQHRMRSRGESIPSSAPRPVVASLPKVLDEIAMALVSGLDPRGTRMVYLAESDPAGGARLFALAIDEDRGIRELEVFSGGRSKIKAFLRDCTRRDAYPALEAPIDAVRALIARSVGVQPADQPAPRGFGEWRHHIAEPAAGASTPGELARAALATEVGPDADGLDRALQLLRDRSIGPWPPANATLSEIAEQIQDAANGVVVVSPGAKRARVDQILEEAVDRVFEGKFSQRSANRFEETAYIFWRRGAIEDARACLAAADAFRGAPAAYRALGRAMLEIVLDPLLQSIERPSEPAEPRDLSSMVGS